MLQRYKEATTPATDQRQRLGEVVQARVLRGDVPRFDVPVLPVAAHAGWLQQLWRSGTLKWGLGAVALGVAGVAGYRLSGGAAAPSLREAPSAMVTRAPVPSAPAAAELLPGPAPVASVAEPVPPDAPRARAEKQSLPAPPASASSEPTIDEEVRLINSAQAALRAGDSKRALEQLSLHAARFPNGKLATLRQVTHMMALCQSGKTAQARQEAAAFVAAKPSSPFVERVKGICSGSN
jgi:hypothetical protein